MPSLTVAEAARRLGVSEWIVKRHIQRGDIEVVGRRRGQGWPRELSIEDVDKVGRMRCVGAGDRQRRTVLIVDRDLHLTDIEAALKASGLIVVEADTILGAMGRMKDNGDRPILFMEMPTGSELNFLRAVEKDVDLVLVGTTLPDGFERAACIEHDELRAAAQLAWKLVEQRPLS